MALGGSVSFEVRTTGSDTNGGGYIGGSTGTDWTQQDNAQYDVSDAVTNGTTTITSATASFGTDVVGNVLYISGGTAPITPGWYAITARTNSTTITVDRNTGLTAGTGATLRIGGALASPGLAVSLFDQTQSNNNYPPYVWIKSGDYSITNSGLGSNGLIDGTNYPHKIIGYENTRGDNGARPKITWGLGAPGSLIRMVVLSHTQSIINIELDGNNTENIDGVYSNTTSSAAINCIGRNFSGTGRMAFNPSNGIMMNCAAFNSNYGFYMGGAGRTIGCYASGNIIGFDGSSSSNSEPVMCIARDNSSYGYFGCVYAFNCIADSNLHGFYATSSWGWTANCISINNSIYGFRTISNTSSIINCASFNDASGGMNSSNIPNINFITLSADPFVDSANGDYRLDPVNGEELFNQGIPVYGQLDIPDIGAIQFDSPSSSSTISIYGIPSFQYE